MKLTALIQVTKNETYLKSSSKLTTGLFVIGGILYYPTNGYGTVIALTAILIVMFGQKMMLLQINKDFAEMYYAKKIYSETQNLDYLHFIYARSAQILQDNKVLSQKARFELTQLREYVERYLDNEQ